MERLKGFHYGCPAYLDLLRQGACSIYPSERNQKLLQATKHRETCLECIALNSQPTDQPLADQFFGAPVTVAECADIQELLEMRIKLWLIDLVWHLMTISMKTRWWLERRFGVCPDCGKRFYHGDHKGHFPF